VLKMNRTLALTVTVLLTACAPRGEKLLERGEASLAKGEYRAAMIDLKNYVGKHPGDARGRAQLGLALLELGDVGGAETEIGKARSLGADRKVIAVPECRLLVARESFQRTLDECADLGDPSIDPELAIVRGDALLGLQRFAEAKGSFETAARARPESLSAVQGLATATFGLEGLAGARRVFEAAPASVKDQPRYWLALGSAEMRGADFVAAERAFTTAVEKTAEEEEDSRDHLSALAGLTEAQLRLGKMKEAAATSDLLLKAAPKSPYAKMLRAQSAANAGDLPTARTLLEEAVSADPQNDQARTMLALINVQQGNLGQAEMHLANIVARNPDNLRAQQLLASVRNQLQSPEQTLESLKPALERQTVDPSLFALAGQLSLQSGNREEAIGYLNQAAQAAGKATPEAQIELAGGYLAAGEIDRAVEILEAMPQPEGAAGAQRETLLAAALLRQGKTAEAIARADALAKQPVADTAAHGLAGAIYAAAGKRDQARKEWGRVLETKPSDSATRINLARLDLAEGKMEAAAGQLNKILADDPKNLMATLGLAAVAQAQKDGAGAERWVKKAVADHPESAEVRLAQAQFYLGTRNFAEAQAAASEALRLSPKSAAAANAKGIAELSAGAVPAAIASFKQAVEFSPRGGYQLNLARAYLVDRKPDEALRVVDDALKVSPKQPAMLALAATVALQANQLEKATGYVERLRAAAPEAAGTMRMEGDLAMAERRYKDAVGYYDKAARLGSDATLAVARYRAGMAAGVAQPQKPLEDWLVRSPGDAVVRVLLAEYEQQRGNDAAAVAGYEKVLETAPDNVMALNNLAGMYQQKGDPRALSLAKRAYDAAPKNAAVQDTYGWALVGSGEVDKGLPLLRDAAKALPGMPEVQYHLGTALARKGETDEARRILKQVVAANVPAHVKTGAEAELKKLDR
jgi:putative PEP-CTERM system TPR-repeat lipoprotein